MIIVGAFLLIICISLIIISWDICRSSPTNRRRRSQYLEFDPAGLDGHIPLPTDHTYAKKTTVYYGLGVSCLYVLPYPS
jgi:hypothetical protein